MKGETSASMHGRELRVNYLNVARNREKRGRQVRRVAPGWENFRFGVIWERTNNL